MLSRIVVTAKKGGSPRRTVDLQKLNKATLRETHHTLSPFNLVSIVPARTRKTVIDTWIGYHTLPLSQTAKDVTTFITERGRYRYGCTLMGFHESGDAYTRRFDDIMSDESQVCRCIDNSMLWDDLGDIEEIIPSIYIKLCTDKGVVFNRNALQFAQVAVEFAEFKMTPEAVQPPDRIIDTIAAFPTPRNVTDVRSWFGLLNQVAYAFSQSAVMTPFRELLATKTKRFYWDSQMDEIF